MEIDTTSRFMRPRGRPAASRSIGALAMIVLVAALLGSVACGNDKPSNKEAKQAVRKLYLGARAYYMDQNYQKGMQFQPLPKQFPNHSTPLTPPLGQCCKEGGKCAPKAEYWASPTWRALEFSMDNPHHYSYQYVLSASTTVGPYTVRAIGDLDCDGIYSTFEMYGVVNETYADGPSANAGMFRQRPLE